MNTLKPRYLEFIDIAVQVSRILPNYSSKFSKKSFTQKQLMALYILKQKSKLSYDEFIDDFMTRESAIADLQLTRVLSPSTLKMFIRRVNTNILEQILSECIMITKGRKLELAIDSTGFQLEDGSYSYLKRLGLSTKKRKNIKLSECADTNLHLFTAVNIRKSDRHDSKEFKPLIKKTKKTRKKIEISVGDKAFDSEELHDFAEKNGFVHIAPLKEKTKQYHRIHGKHRKKLSKYFPEKRYHRKSIIENMWFCVKRLCGKVVMAKKWVMQKKEMIGKVIAYNVHRLVKLLRI
ncbi:transposase [Candidatus Pacearchaeota archaeon]|nr:transposase [Candidatus Pacearchaeota archaeon]